MASEKNPLEAYLTEKQAGFGAGMREGLRGALGGDAEGFGKSVGKNVGRGAMGVTGALAVAGATAGVQRLYDAATKARDFRAMLDADQDLAARQAEDPKRFNMLFSTIRTMNPAFSRDPIVAGALMNQMLENPSSAPGVAMNILPMRDKMRSPFEAVPRALSGGKGRKE